MLLTRLFKHHMHVSRHFTPKAAQITKTGCLIELIRAALVLASAWSLANYLVALQLSVLCATCRLDGCRRLRVVLGEFDGRLLVCLTLYILNSYSISFILP